MSRIALNLSVFWNSFLLYSSLWNGFMLVVSGAARFSIPDRSGYPASPAGGAPPHATKPDDFEEASSCHAPELWSPDARRGQPDGRFGRRRRLQAMRCDLSFFPVAVKDLFLALRDRTRCTAFRVQNRMSPEAPGRSRTVPSGLRTTRRGTTRPPRTTKANSSPL